MQTFNTSEKHLLQIPALQLLIALGYEYISPKEALKERLGKTSNVLLENILREQLKKINHISFKSKEYLFSEENIQSAVQKLKNTKYDGLLKTNEAIYNLITLGTAMEQTIEGDSKSFNLNYVDWRNPERNCFHVTIDYSVECSRNIETACPDIVLFVNGIPLCVIECKFPQVEISETIAQFIKNQHDDYIPKLFVYTQIVLALNKNSAMYATTGTLAKFWSIWKEAQLQEENAEFSKLGKIINQSQTVAVLAKIVEIFNVSSTLLEGNRPITEQDKAVFVLCRPKRLLELAWKFTVFDSGTKKIARYQQYFVIKSALKRVNYLDNKGSRKGGIIWHTQGSGKSLTLVMLARNLALDPEIKEPRIVLVSDRDDLNKQLQNTFSACGLDPKRATSGRKLLELVTEKKSSIITTRIHKSDKAYSSKKYYDDSANIFFLIDEDQRTQFVSFTTRMRQMFPNACYVGFTGTPLSKKDKHNFIKFGELIEPHYSIPQAVADGAIVPLLYEGRHAEMMQNQSAVDLWFERHTQGLTKAQKVDLRRKYDKKEMLNQADKIVYMRAFDISEHFRSNWQNTGFKAQLVASSKDSALKYCSYLNELGTISSDVVISHPNVREGYEEIDDEPSDDVMKFWQKKMKRYGSEDEYTKQLINQFKHGSEPEILIVVDKLLTSFDAPKNTVLYLCRHLREHSFLQAIARVNRLHEGKNFGFIIDYAGILSELDESLTLHNDFECFDDSDLVGTLSSVNTEIEKLSGRYFDLWNLFKTVKNSYYEEPYERLLADNELREEFYSRFFDYAKILATALSCDNFLLMVDEKILSNYKKDLQKFQALKTSVKLRYAEATDYRDFDPQIKKLLDTHIQANYAMQLNRPVNIFNDTMLWLVKEEATIYQSPKTTASKADTIAHATKKVITEKMDENPVFYEKFSKLIKQVIEDFRAKRISDLDYLDKIGDIKNKLLGNAHDDVPECLEANKDAMDYYGVLTPFFEKHNLSEVDLQSIVSDTAIAVYNIFETHKKLHFWDDEDAQKQTMNQIDDYLYDELKTKNGIDLSLKEMDSIIEKVLQVAKRRTYK